MKNSRNNRIWVILMACLLLFMGVSAGVGTAYSRYENESSEIIVYPGDEMIYVWEFLEEENLMDTMPSELDITIPEAETEIEETVEAAEEETAAEVVVIEDMVTMLMPIAEDGMLLICIQYPEGCNQAALSWNEEGFAMGTVFTMDGLAGSKLSEAGFIGVSRQDETADKQLLMIETTEAMTEGTLRVTYFNSESVIQSYSEVLVEKKENPTAFSIELNGDTQVLGKKGTISWKTVGDEANSDIRTKINFLTLDGYTEELPDQYLGIAVARVTEEETAALITVSNPEDGETYATAGTYRVDVTRVYVLNDEDVNLEMQLQKTSVPFFVNYR